MTFQINTTRPGAQAVSWIIEFSKNIFFTAIYDRFAWIFCAISLVHTPKVIKSQTKNYFLGKKGFFGKRK